MVEQKGVDDFDYDDETREKEKGLPPYKEEDDLCIKCYERPKYYPYEYCSRDCGRKCSLPDCDEKRFEGSLYCTQVHRKAAVQLGVAKACIKCGLFPHLPDSVFCGKTCQTAAIPSDPLASGSKRVPRAPNAFTKPRSSFQISFGEFKGDPSFILRSKRGLCWGNLPGPLHQLCDRKGMSDDVIDFSLGTNGRFYFAYKEGDVGKVVTSKDLWDELDEDFHGGSIRQIQFGADGAYWGIKSYRKYRNEKGDPDSPTSSASDLNRRRSVFMNQANDGGDRRHQRDSAAKLEPPQDPRQRRASNTQPEFVIQEEPFGQIPGSMIDKCAEVYPELAHYGQVDFASVGVGKSWVIGLMGKLCFWDNVEPAVVRKIAGIYSQGGSLRNVALSPVDPTIYLIEAKDGTVKYHVPDDWHHLIKHHLHPKFALDFEPRLAHNHHPRPRHSTHFNTNHSGPPKNNGNPGPQSKRAPPPYVQNGPYPSQPYFQPPSFPPPQQFRPPPPYHTMNPAMFNTNVPSSGVIQASGKKDNHDILVATIKAAAPVAAAVAPHMVTLAAGGCNIM